MNQSFIPSFYFHSDFVSESDFFSQAFENRPIKIGLVTFSGLCSIMLVSNTFERQLHTSKRLSFSDSRVVVKLDHI